ncbi:EF-hand domain-containing protein 1 [Trichonephila clavipes]|nr:EF-hand domain-containing protein 1 [Trichonephila clavipes]
MVVNFLGYFNGQLVKSYTRYNSSTGDTPRETEQIRRFIISFFMEDETVRIYEESVPNSGFGSGIFLLRSHLKKKRGQSSLKDTFYEPKDFYVGAKIVANGSTFVLTDADVRFYTFVENHPEIYTDINAEDQKRLADMLKGKQELTENQKMHLLKDLRDAVFSNYGCSVYPTEAVPDIGIGLSTPDLVIDKLYSGNLPISQELLKRLVDAFTFDGRTELDEVRAFLLVALGHDRDHGK